MREYIPKKVDKEKEELKKRIEELEKEKQQLLYRIESLESLRSV